MIVKLMDEEEGEGWTLEQSLIAEKLYKRFLILNLKYNDTSIVPTKVIDTFWHYHILDTKKYVEDCEFCFGYFVHHFPYFGMRGEEDAQNLKNTFDNSSSLFLTEFGETIDESHDSFDLYSKNSANCDGSGSGDNQCGSCKGQCGKCEPGRAEAYSTLQPKIRPYLNEEQQEIKRHFILN
jgi:hypothetical protein